MNENQLRCICNAADITCDFIREKFVWDDKNLVGFWAGMWAENYIHNNPVEAGLVKQAHEWVYSSASNYHEMESVIEVERISQRLITY